MGKPSPSTKVVPADSRSAEEEVHYSSLSEGGDTLGSERQVEQNQTSLNESDGYDDIFDELGDDHCDEPLSQADPCVLDESYSEENPNLLEESPDTNHDMEPELVETKPEILQVSPKC